MNKAELIESIVESTQLEKKEVTKVVESVVSVIQNQLKQGVKVAISGLGSFEVVEKKARTARNPKTGESIQVAAKKAPKFKPGKELKTIVWPG